MGENYFCVIILSNKHDYAYNNLLSVVLADLITVIGNEMSVQISRFANVGVSS